MLRTPWQLIEPDATLQLGALHATVNSARPCAGLAAVVVAGRPLTAARLLGIAASSTTGAHAIEHYVRGRDLVVAYEESGEWPVHIDAVWRAAALTPADQFLAAVDLIVSVHTHLLDSHPQLSVQSLVPAGEVLRLQGIEPVACTRLAAPASIAPENGTGCLLFRLEDEDVSYVEMVHPADFQRDELGGGEPDGNATRVVHRLFRTTLEKGVILRARVRGVFVKRSDDVETAAQCYAAFAAADPPLGP